MIACEKEVCEVLVAQSYLTLCKPMDCSLAGSSVHGIPGKNTGVSCHKGIKSLSLGDFSNPGIEPGSPTLQADSLSSELPGKPERERHNRETEIIDEKIYTVDRYLINICSNKPIK